MVPFERRRGTRIASVDVSNLMIDLSGREIGMLREGGAGDRRARRSGRVIFGVVLVVMGMMVFVILVGFPR